MEPQNLPQPPVQTTTPPSDNIPGQDARYRFLGITGIILGLFLSIISIIFLFLVIPQMNALYANLHVGKNSANALIAAFILLGLGVVNVFIGVKFLRSISQNKWFKIVIILGIIIILFAGFLSKVIITETLNPIQNLLETPDGPIPPLVSPTPTVIPTANWKTYTDSAYNYSIKYPPTWTASVSDKVIFSPPGADILASTKVDEPGSGLTPYVSIRFVSQESWKPEHPESIEKLTQLTFDKTQGYYYKDIGMTSYNIFDLPYTAVKGTLRFSNVSFGSYIDEFNRNHKTSVEDADEDTFKKILATFKFTNQNPKTYTNSDLGISFQYPSDWKIVDEASTSAAFYPPASDHQWLGDSISFFFLSKPFLPQPTPGLGMMPYTQKVVNGIIGRQTEDNPNGLGRIGGCSHIYQIELPIKQGILILDSCASLLPQLTEILKNLKIN